MIPKELFEKIRRIEIKTSRLVTDVFAGQYHSVFKGQGIEFDEVREYNIGDDIRAIDWNVTARTGKPHIKKFVEERELTVMLLVDGSSSCQFGSKESLKSQIAAELSALLALSAIRNNDKVGLIIFTDEIELYMPPKKGSKYALRVLREALYFEPKGHRTDINHALEYLNRVQKRKTIAFLVSDFFSGHADDEIKLQKTFAITNKKHDLIAVTLNDPREIKLEDAGIISLIDNESGERFYIDSSDKQAREVYHQLNLKRVESRERLFRRSGMDFINIWTDQSYSDALIKFFKDRKKRVR